VHESKRRGLISMRVRGGVSPARVGGRVSCA
jgi:hypothetical protein